MRGFRGLAVKGEDSRSRVSTTGWGDAFSNFLGEDKFGAAKRKPRVHGYTCARASGLGVVVGEGTNVVEETRLRFFDSWPARLGIFLIHRRRVTYCDVENN